MMIPENTSANTHETLFQLLMSQKNQIKHVVDIPCGEGAFTQRLLQAGFHAVSLDCANIMKVDHANFSVANMNDVLPIPNKQVDALVCIDGIEHIERPFDFIKECHRILRDGGHVFISTPNISSLRSRWRWFLTGFHNKCKAPLDETSPNPLHHINMFSYPELRYLLHTNGFVIQHITTNRKKFVSILYGLLAPLMYVVTLRVFKKELRTASEKRLGQEIIKEMFSANVLFGETLIIQAQKKGGSPKEPMLHYNGGQNTK